MALGGGTKSGGRGGGGAAAAGGTGMVVPQVRPRCTHREEAAAAAEVGAPREVSETARARRAAPALAAHGPRSVVPTGRAQLEFVERRARSWAELAAVEAPDTLRSYSAGSRSPALRPGVGGVD